MLERVQKIIAAAGFCSRRAAEELIVDGHVKVNGKPVNLGDKADSHIDHITVDGKSISLGQKFYVLLYKPKYYETTLADNTGRRTITQLLKYPARLYPVGRLDYNTEGLLLVTNDGHFANTIMHPRYNIDKTYQAELDKPITPQDIERLKRGVRLKDGPVSNVVVRVVSKDRKFVEVMLHEGRNKIVKRIFGEMGYYVKGLIRTRIGFLTIGSLKPGRNRKLSTTEVERMLDLAVIKPHPQRK